MLNKKKNNTRLRYSSMANLILLVLKMSCKTVLCYSISAGYLIFMQLKTENMLLML